MKRILTKHRQDRDLKGFTLIELLIVTVIMVIVFYAALDFFNSQQKVFRVQATQTRNQSNLRMGVFYLTRDVANGGFTGTPFGIEAEDYRALNLGAASTVVPVSAIDFANDTNFSPYKLTNQTGHTVDGLIVYGNLDETGRTTHLSNQATAGTDTIYANSVDMFQSSVRLCPVSGSTIECNSFASTVSPYGLIITNQNAAGEFEQVLDANTASKTIKLASGTQMKGTFGSALAAPVYKRAYYIRNDPKDLSAGTAGTRWLVRRDFYADNKQSDTKIAEGVSDLQVTYDMKDKTGKIRYEVDPDTTTIDPRYIVAVNVRMTTLTTDPDLKKPLPIVMTRKIRMMNVGIHKLLHDL